MRSNLEKRVAQELEEAGVKFEYEKTSYEYWTTVYQCECIACGNSEVKQWHWYTPDFFLENGIILEVKGRMTPKDRKIQLAMKEQWPDLDIRMVFGENNKLRKNSKTRYADWCKRYGVSYTIKHLPKEWL